MTTMRPLEVIWTEDNVAHIAENGISTNEVEQALDSVVGRDQSESNGRPIVFGYTDAGRKLAIVYEQIDEITIYPITAFEVE